MKTTALIIAAAAIVLGSAAPALAAGHSWQVGDAAVHVVLADTDLQTADGRAQALGRVEKAAVRLCGHDGVLSEQQACVAGIVATSLRGHAGLMLKLAQEERAGATRIARN